MDTTISGIKRQLHRQMLWQVAARAAAAALLTSLIIWMFYQTGLRQHEKHLLEIVENQAGWIEVIAGYSRAHDNATAGRNSAQLNQSTLNQLRAVHHNFPGIAGIGRSGEITLAHRQGDRIVFLLRHRHNGMGQPNHPVLINSGLAEPMRRALTGKSGSIETLDYRGKEVLAAYRPIPQLGWGIVAKIDLDELNAPYVRIGWIVVLLVTLLVSGSAFFAFRSVRPLMLALTHSEERYRKLIEEQNDLVIAFDPEFKLTFVSNNYCETFGYSREELLCSTFIPLIHPDDQAKVHESLQRIFSPPYTTSHEERARTVHGWRWFHWSDQAIVDQRGEVREIIAVGRDITDRKRAEQERDDSMQLLQQHAVVFDNAIEAVLITDTDANIVSVNPSFSRITGFSRDEVLGHNASLLKSGKHDDAFYRKMYSELEQHGRWQGEIWNRRKDGEVFPAWETITRVDNEGIPDTLHSRYIAIFSDISARKGEEERITWLAHHDALTELPNRLLFKERCEHALTRVQRSGNQLAFMFIDLDAFKPVNDSLGHAVGDQLLQEAARRLKAVVRQQDTLARMGGDEFAVLLEDVHEQADAEVVAGKIVSELHLPFTIAGKSIEIGGSVGIALYPDDGVNWDVLMEKADSAMYQAKSMGRGKYAFVEDIE